MAVFDGVRYSLSPSLSPPRRNELAAILDLNGATPHPPYTHLIALPASHAHNHAASDPELKLVTDRWVDRSVVMGKRQSEQYYSPDPAMIFSGVVACATDLSAADLEVLSAGITALGGQWRIGLTRDVTHLFALRPGSDKYNTALHFAPQTHMVILTPHWFDDAVRLGRRIPEMPYSWPDPPALRPGLILDFDKDPLSTEGRRRRKPAGDTDTELGDGSNQSKQAHVWERRRILLSISLELSEGSRRAIEAGIQRADGVVVPIAEDSDGDAEEKAVDECDVLITRWRSGKAYFKAAHAPLLVGTLSWLFSVESSGTLHSPLDSLLWYPAPRGGIPELVDCEISITNYTGAARDYLKRLIVLVGAKFTPSMSQSNKVLVAGFQPSPKTTRALTWSIPVVNHTWLEDCFVEWRALTVGLERYIMYPPGIDFGKMLMTQHDGPPSSQSLPTPRFNGGAVPGGRGVGVVDLQQEETRDAEYRTSEGESACGSLRMHNALTNDSTTDGISMVQLDGEAPTESRGQARSRASSGKKTPSSMRMKRGSISTPMTASATGAFVDHVVELPLGDGEVNTCGKRRPPTNSKQRAPLSAAGSRASSCSVSRPSSVGPSRTEKRVEVAMRDPGVSSRDGKDKGKGKGSGDTIKDGESRRTRPIDENEDTAQPTYPPKPKSHLVQRGSDVRTDDENEVEKRANAKSSKPHRVKGTVIGSHSDAHEHSVESLPPRRTTGVGSATPIKSGMKPRPRPKSQSQTSLVLGGESGDELREMAAAPTTGGRKRQKDLTEPRHSGKTAAKDKGKDRKKEVESEEEEATTRPRSPTRSPLLTSPKTKTSRTPKRRLSVLVPSVPKDYFSSQDSCGPIRDVESDREPKSAKHAGAPSESRHKQLEPAASMSVVAAEAPTSERKRGRPSTAGMSTPGKSKLQPKAKPRPSVTKQATKTRDDDDGDTDEDEGNDDTPLIVETPETSTSRVGLRRGAANKATARLREVIMPDVISFEKEQKKAKRRRSLGGESVVTTRDEDGEGEGEGEKRGGKRRKVAIDGEEDEEAEVEDVVLAPSVKAKQKPIGGKVKARKPSAADSDKEMDELPAKSKPSRSQEKKGTRGREKELATTRLMTTGVSLSDDVIKRLAKLGVQMTTKPTDCTHLVAKGIVRTEKFLCAMSVSPYILTEEWANASAKGAKLLDENDYLLSDAAAEQKWAFKFADAIARAKGSEGGSNLFKQMTFYVTPKVSVDAKLLKNVVSAGGGVVQPSTTPTVRILKAKPNRYVVSCQEDKAIWRPLAQEGFRIYSHELVLRAALRQQIEWEREECMVTG